MFYYDIHTHQIPASPEEIAIINMSVGVGQDLIGLEGDGGRQGRMLLRSYGIHPWYIKDVQEQMSELRRLVSGSNVVAIGEAGLDKMADTSVAEQKEVFMAQVGLAEEIRKPLIIHCVKAWPELIACRKEARPDQPWIIHGFRGNGELAGQLIRQGFYLSFGLYFQPSAVRAAWPETLFAETDENPVGIHIVYQNLSHSLSVPVFELAEQIGKNVSIFSIDK